MHKRSQSRGYQTKFKFPLFYCRTARSDILDGVSAVNGGVLSPSDPFERLEAGSTVWRDIDGLVLGIHHICLALRTKCLW